MSDPKSVAAQEEDDLILSNPMTEGMTPLVLVPNYRDRMRETIEELSVYARGRDPSFILTARPGFELPRWDVREFILAEAKRPAGAMIPEDAIIDMGEPIRTFIQAIDGVVLSNQFCGEGLPLPNLQRFQAMGVEMLSIEHCGTDAAAVRAFEQSRSALMISHGDSDRMDSFERIPMRRPIAENPDNVENLEDARNMLVATATRPYGSRGEWLLAASGNNYDVVVVVDAFFNGAEPLSKEEVHSLKFKELGARRLVLAWLDITYASDDRFYWERTWGAGNPSWIVGRHPDRPGAFAVEYWHPRWRSIIGLYFAGLMDLGFDGVLLNGSDAYLRFEAMTPLEPL